MDSDLNNLNDDIVNTPNLEQLLQLGIQTARQGNKQNARVIFQQVLDADKQNERAWLWMAATASTPAERERYLQTVLRINPNNPTAQRELKKLQKNRASSNNQALIYGGLGLGIVVILLVIAILVLTVF